MGLAVSPSNMRWNTMETIINVKQTALMLIDMHRGHLDPDVATLPVDATWAMEILV